MRRRRTALAAGYSYVHPQGLVEAEFGQRLGGLALDGARRAAHDLGGVALAQVLEEAQDQDETLSLRQPPERAPQLVTRVDTGLRLDTVPVGQLRRGALPVPP